MRLLVGHSINWGEPYGVIEDIQDYNLDKSMAAASLLDEVAELITIAKQCGGPAKLTWHWSLSREARWWG